MPPINIDIPQIQVITRYTAVRGLTVESLSTQLGEYFGAPNGRGLLVTSVEKGTAAETAGLKAGDVIVRVNGEKVTDMADWRSAIRGKAGQSLTLGIIREKREQSVTLKLPERGANDASWLRFDYPNVGEIMAQVRDLDVRALAGSSHAVEDAMREVERALRESQREFDRQMRESERELDRKMREHEREIQLKQREAERQKQRMVRLQ